MSVQAITWALDYAAGSVAEKVILLVLANYANEYGISWPSQKTLAGQTALGERTVRRVLADMEGRGVIRRIVRRRGNVSRQSDMILLSAFEGRKPAPRACWTTGQMTVNSALRTNRPTATTGRLTTGYQTRTPRPQWPPLILQSY